MKVTLTYKILGRLILLPAIFVQLQSRKCAHNVADWQIGLLTRIILIVD